MKQYQLICEDCTNLRVSANGEWACLECFRGCDELDHCPLNYTAEEVEASRNLTAEQKQVEKKMRNCDTHTAKQPTASKGKANPDKEYLVQYLQEALAEFDPTITNKTRELTFVYNDKPYKLTLTATRT